MVKHLASAWVKQPLVQILVVVASIQMRTLKTEVEKGSIWTADGHGLVDPKRWANSVWKCSIMGHLSKGNQVYIPELECGFSGPFGPHLQSRNWTRRWQQEPWEEFSFLVNDLTPWNLIGWRYGLIVSKAPPFLWCPVGSWRPLKILGKDWFSHPFVLITSAGLLGEQSLV